MQWATAGPDPVGLIQERGAMESTPENTNASPDPRGPADQRDLVHSLGFLAVLTLVGIAMVLTEWHWQA